MCPPKVFYAAISSSPHLPSLLSSPLLFAPLSSILSPRLDANFHTPLFASQARSSNMVRSGPEDVGLSSLDTLTFPPLPSLLHLTLLHFTLSHSLKSPLLPSPSLPTSPPSSCCRTLGCHRLNMRLSAQSEEWACVPAREGGMTVLVGSLLSLLSDFQVEGVHYYSPALLHPLLTCIASLKKDST